MSCENCDKLMDRIAELKKTAAHIDKMYAEKSIKYDELSLKHTALLERCGEEKIRAILVKNGCYATQIKTAKAISSMLKGEEK